MITSLNESINEINEYAISFFTDKSVIRSSFHVLKSGRTSGSYIDFDLLTNNSFRCEVIAQQIVYKIQEYRQINNIDVLSFINKDSGGTVGMIRLSGLISVLTSMPSVIVKLDKDIISERVRFPEIENVPLTKRLDSLKCILLTDHCTTGSELLAASNAISDSGGDVKAAIAFTYSSLDLKYTEFVDRGIDFLGINEITRENSTLYIKNTDNPELRSSWKESAHEETR